MKVYEIIINGLNLEQREVLNALLEQEGYEGFWLDGSAFKAYVAEKLFSLSQLEDLIYRTAPQSTYNCEVLEEKNWNASWESHFQPVEINQKLRIRAPFHPSDSGFNQELVIEPQMSFGTGHHNTTSLMAGYLMNVNLEGKAVLDMGCGTGVLAILAAKLGASKITAIDIEDNATENTLHNMSLNGVQNIEVLTGDVSVIPNVQYDLILANINKNILLKDIPVYVEHMCEKGLLLLSGFFSTDEEQIQLCTSENSLYLLDIVRKNEWSLVVVEKR